jgi:hypothetical protein
MSRARALESPAPTWVEALAVLPPAVRLQVQRTVAADVAVQEAWPKSGAAALASPHPPLSRAYCSGSSEALAPGKGLGVYRSLAMSRTSCGGHVSAVSRKFPSTAGLLAGLLAEAARAAGRPLPPPSAAALAAAAAAGEGGAAAVAVCPQDPSLLPLAADLSAHGLEAAYRVLLAKALQRKLKATQKEAPGAAPIQPCPATDSQLATGLLEAEAIKAVARARERVKAEIGAALELD